MEIETLVGKDFLIHIINLFVEDGRQGDLFLWL